jgi:hypothetical protein
MKIWERIRPGRGEPAPNKAAESPQEQGASDPFSPRPPRRFSVGDLVRIKGGGNPLGRVARILPDGTLMVSLYEVGRFGSGPARWGKPRKVRPSDVTNNYGRLDDVGIGSKIFEASLLRHIS